MNTATTPPPHPPHPLPPRWITALGGKRLQQVAPIVGIYMQHRRSLYKGLGFGSLHAVGGIFDVWLLRAAVSLGPWGATLLLPFVANKILQEGYVRPRSQNALNHFADQGAADVLKYVTAKTNRRRPLTDAQSADLVANTITDNASIRTAWRCYIPWIAIDALGAASAIVGTFIVVGSAATGIAGAALFGGMCAWVGWFTYKAVAATNSKLDEAQDLAKASRQRLLDVFHIDGWSLFQRTGRQDVAQARVNAALDAEASATTAADVDRARAGGLTGITVGVFSAISIAWALIAGNVALAIPLILLGPAVYAASRLPDNVLGAIPGIKAARRISTFLNDHSGIQSPPFGLHLPSRMEQGLTLDRVSYVVGGKHVLHDVSLSVRPGEVVALIGPTGSGKTTLLDMVQRLTDPTRGKVAIDNIDLRRAHLHSLDGLIVRVNQKPHVLTDLSVKENIRLGNLDVSDAAIRDACRKTGFDAWLRKHGDRLDAVPTRLSAGERKRLELTRMRIKPGSLLLLDEPTAELDPTGIRVVLDDIRRAKAAGHSVLVVTHDPRIARRADKVVSLDHGRIVEIGKPAVLLTRPDSCLSKMSGQPLTTPLPEHRQSAATRATTEPVTLLT